MYLCGKITYIHIYIKGVQTNKLCIYITVCIYIYYNIYNIYTIYIYNTLYVYIKEPGALGVEEPSELRPRLIYASGASELFGLL